MTAHGWLARTVAFGRSAPLAIVLLVAANLVPLAGVLWFGWDVATILTMYWLENGIVGVLNIVRILLASGTDVRYPGGLANAGPAAFFTVHYGFFWLIHGVFLAVVVGGSGRPVQFDLLYPLRNALAEPAILLGGAALLVSHGASLLLNYIGQGEYRRVTAGAQMFLPYPRVFIMHVVVIMSGWLVIARGQPELLVALLVVLKTGVDLAFHVAERARYGRARADAPGAGPPIV